VCALEARAAILIDRRPGSPLGTSEPLRSVIPTINNPSVSTMCVAKRHIDEEPWSRQKGYDGIGTN
jgi:hypothetical protein